MMSKKSFVAVLMALALPLLCYFLLTFFSAKAVVLPKRYFYDTVVTRNDYGKEVQDTIWHQVRNFTLTNQLDKQVSLNDLKGKIIVADFFFTSCPNICPTLTRNMKRLQDAFNKTDTVVRFLSFSVDPKRDSAERLKKYSDKYGLIPIPGGCLPGAGKKYMILLKKNLKPMLPIPI